MSRGSNPKPPRRWRAAESSRAPRARPSSARERWATVRFWLVRIPSPRSAILNDAIKLRDFWMPFAPSVLAERAADYYDKPKPVASPYMMFAFRSRPATASGLRRRAASLRFHHQARTKCGNAITPAITGCSRNTRRAPSEGDRAEYLVQSTWRANGLSRQRRRGCVPAQRPPVHGAGQLVGGEAREVGQVANCGRLSIGLAGIVWA